MRRDKYQFIYAIYTGNKRKNPYICIEWNITRMTLLIANSNKNNQLLSIVAKHYKADQRYVIIG